MTNDTEDVRRTITERPTNGTLGTYKILTSRPDCVSETTSEFREGQNKHSGKRFTYYTVMQRQSISMRSGKLRVYNYSKPFKRPGRIEDITAQYNNWAVNEAVANEFLIRQGLEPVETNLELRMRKRILSDKIMSMAYPILADRPVWLEEGVRPGLSSALRAESSREFVEKVYGKSRYRKDLLRAVGGSNQLNGVAFTAMWRGLVPVDWIVTTLETGTRMDGLERTLDRMNFRKMVGQMDMATRKRLLTNAQHRPGERRGMMLNRIRDAVWNWDLARELPAERISTWDELHDLISRDARRKETANQTVPQDSKVYKALDGLEVSGYRLESVKETHELIDWGNRLSNCIAGYNRQAVAERTFLFGIWQGDRLTGSMEVSGDGYVQQCVGFYNEYHAAKDEIQRAVTNALVRRKK